ncbi:MAG: hypothetical protein ACK5UB_05780, partial [Pseudanabaena sp.]
FIVAKRIKHKWLRDSTFFHHYELPWVELLKRLYVVYKQPRHFIETFSPSLTGANPPWFFARFHCCFIEVVL